MVSWKLRALRGKQRRDFLKLMVAAGAGLGIGRSDLLNFISDTGGSGLAEAAVGKASRALMVTCGNGVFGWFQELWMTPEVATSVSGISTQKNAAMAYLYHSIHGYDVNAPGNSPGYSIDFDTAKQTGDRPMVYSPAAPWMQNKDQPASVNNKPKYHVTAIIAGNDETHTLHPNSAAIVSSASDLGATVAAIQAKLGAASIVPAIGVNPLVYGQAKNAPPIATVPNAQGMIDLFNSSASQVVLAADEDRLIFETYYNALVGLRRAAPRSSWQPELAITKNAAHLIGVNFGGELTPTNQDLIDFGVIDLLADDLFEVQRAGLEGFARTLISLAHAFRIGLTNMALVGLSPKPTEGLWVDPHKTFNSSQTKSRGRNTAKYLGKALDAFYRVLDNHVEPGSSSETMADNTVFMAWGDTPHTPLQGSGWPDATPEDSNWLYVMDPKDYITKGWFGQVHTNGDVSGFDPVTGTETTSIAATQTAPAAGAAGAYAVAKGDWLTVADYYAGPKIKAMIKT
jgi:hypothetical protein